MKFYTVRLIAKTRRDRTGTIEIAFYLQASDALNALMLASVMPKFKAWIDGPGMKVTQVDIR